jgi:hypothetical protein
MVILARHVVRDRSSCLVEVPVAEASEEASQRIAGPARRYFDNWPGLPVNMQVGAPELVRQVSGEPSYWLVPGLVAGRIEVVARILDNGQLATIARLPEPASDCAAAVTGLSAVQAAGYAREVEAKYSGKLTAGPTLVHDGPVGREAWLYRLHTAAAGAVWAFATAGGTYARATALPPAQPF